MGGKMGQKRPSQAVDLNADRPIQDSKHDRLNRTGFASSIAQCLANWDGRDSLVISLSGKWGSGKSSVKNLIREELSKLDENERPVFHEFIPWTVSGDHILDEAFFEELGRAIGKTDSSKSTVRLINTLRVYQARLKLGEFFLKLIPLKAIRKGLAFALSVLALFSLNYEWVSPWFAIACLSISLFIWLFSTADQFFEYYIKLLEARVSASKKSILELKEELTSLMGQLKKPVIISIDEIDRLTSDELGLLCRLIKCNADFPNLVYLLLYDQGYVEDALKSFLPSELEEGRGKDYLKKIVQVSFQIPEAPRELFEKVLFEGLDKILKSAGAEKKFNKDRWGLIFHDGIRPLFSTLRDVNRYLSTLSFYFGMFEGKKVFELDPVDLIALEAIRVHEPQLYSSLPYYKDDIIKTTTRIRFDDEKGERKKVVEELLSKVSKANLDAISVLVKGIFPEVAGILGGYGSYQGTMESWYQQTRACHEDYFDRYFTLVFSSDQLTDSEIHSFIDDLKDITKTEKNVNKFVKRNRLKFLLDALENYKNEVPVEHFESIAVSLINIGDLLPPSGLGLFGDDPRMTCTRIILYMMSRMKDENERTQRLKRVFEKATDFVIPTYVDHIIKSLKKDGWGDLGVLFQSDDNIIELSKTLASRINDAAQGKTLRVSTRISLTLKFWSEFGDKQIQRNWLDEVIQNPQNAIKFIVGFSQSISNSSRREIGYRISIPSLQEYFSTDVIDKSLANYNTKDAREKLIIDMYELSKKNPNPKESVFGDSESYVWSEIKELY
ncbi:hypothetical protein JNK13_03885 [bacterium]|nr:hypothetical protein [bacterium]